MIEQDVIHIHIQLATWCKTKEFLLLLLCHSMKQ